ncbi:DUF983 domain-containing protein [Erythrobacter sp. SCSIO 43205]|uniref:DUF983 domain-containing protein n=1 Tax=Erythrobacter sp. SCSIO 43205 TaxID=2779361 RepID=UPI001CA9A8D6|nr:DUF983 domain-containing protein [Erythrobacter sp. SCSIO 43205]UAB79504.1 DUF983 domain-containing protein [Erythrobacter sp. SCSIO 43205]
MTSGESQDTQKGQSGILRAALLGSCPQCAEPTLFEAPARVAMKCSACGLNFTKYERGGRVSGLFTVVIAIVLIVIAVLIENSFRPPLWLQAAFWAPVTVGTVIYALRLFKTVLLYAAYENAKERGE